MKLYANSGKEDIRFTYTSVNCSETKRSVKATRNTKYVWRRINIDTVAGSVHTQTALLHDKKMVGYMSTRNNYLCKPMANKQATLQSFDTDKHYFEHIVALGTLLF